MSQTERFASSETLGETLLAGAVFLSGYADLPWQTGYRPSWRSFAFAPRWGGRFDETGGCPRGEDSDGWLDPTLVWYT